MYAYGITEFFRALKCICPSSELSHSILAMAISQVSLTVRSGSDRYVLRIGTEEDAEIAPIASAAYNELYGHLLHFGYFKL